MSLVAPAMTVAACSRPGWRESRSLGPEIETLFIVTDAQYSYLSSRGVKEVFHFGGSVQDMVPPGVYRRLRERIPPPDLREP